MHMHIIKSRNDQIKFTRKIKDIKTSFINLKCHLNGKTKKEKKSIDEENLSDEAANFSKTRKSQCDLGKHLC